MQVTQTTSPQACSMSLINVLELLLTVCSNFGFNLYHYNFSIMESAYLLNMSQLSSQNLSFTYLQGQSNNFQNLSGRNKTVFVRMKRNETKCHTDKNSRKTQRNVTFKVCVETKRLFRIIYARGNVPSLQVDLHHYSS